MVNRQLAQRLDQLRRVTLPSELRPDKELLNFDSTFALDSECPSDSLVIRVYEITTVKNPPAVFGNCPSALCNVRPRSNGCPISGPVLEPFFWAILDPALNPSGFERFEPNVTVASISHVAPHEFRNLNSLFESLYPWKSTQ